MINQREGSRVNQKQFKPFFFKQRKREDLLKQQKPHVFRKEREVSWEDVAMGYHYNGSEPDVVCFCYFVLVIEYCVIILKLNWFIIDKFIFSIHEIILIIINHKKRKVLKNFRLLSDNTAFITIIFVLNSNVLLFKIKMKMTISNTK